MSTSIQNVLSSNNNYIEQLLASSLQSAGVTAASTNAASSLPISSVTGDSNQLSPFAQIASTLQQLQESSPSEYQQITQTIATNLQNAAQQAQSEGNSTEASQLNQLATDFKNASSSGQLPNLQDLAQTLNGSGGHHHHHHGVSSADSDSSSLSNSEIAQWLANLQANGTASSTSSLNPLKIIADTLQSAGISR